MALYGFVWLCGIGFTMVYHFQSSTVEPQPKTRQVGGLALFQLASRHGPGTGWRVHGKAGALRSRCQAGLLETNRFPIRCTKKDPKR